MTTFPAWLLLGTGTFQAVGTILTWRAGQPWGTQARLTAMSMLVAVSMLTTGWVRVIAWTVLGVAFVISTIRSLNERSLSTLVISIPFYAIMVFIALTEAIVDDIAPWQRAIFGAVGVFTGAALVKMIVRLVQRRHRPRESAERRSL